MILKSYSDRKYLVVKACAGLGNRLVTVFSAIVYCKKNRRMLVVDWSDGQFEKKGINAFYKCFKLEDVVSTDTNSIENWQDLSHSSDLFKVKKNEGVYDLYFDKQSKFWLKFPLRLFFNDKLKKLRRRWQPIINGTAGNSLNYGSDLSDNLKHEVLYYIDFLPYINYDDLPKYVKLQPVIEEKINSIAQKLNLISSIGVHIRNTDKRPTKSIEVLIEYIKSNHLTEAVFLSTDSVEIESLFSEKIPNLILFPKTKPKLNGEGLHQWALYNNEEELKYTLFEESVIEMFLLSKCKFLYYQGNSTFSNISKVYHLNKNNCYDWLKL